MKATREQSTPVKTPSITFSGFDSIGKPISSIKADKPSSARLESDDESKSSGQPNEPGPSNCKQTADPDARYVPTPYTFRVPARGVPLNRVSAQCPPFYLQMDHTLAVIWMLFDQSLDEVPGIVQLQWALNFLRGIYLPSGERPRDVGRCIRLIEALLIDLYADMAGNLDELERSKRISRDKSKSKAENKKQMCASETCFGRMSTEEPEEMFAEMEEAPDLQNLPFSINYVEMNERAVAHVKELSAKGSKASLVPSVLALDIPEERTLEFLHQWRKDQLTKLTSEMKKLRAIEKYLGTSATNFEGSASLLPTYPSTDQMSRFKRNT